MQALPPLTTDSCCHSATTAHSTHRQQVKQAIAQPPSTPFTHRTACLAGCFLPSFGSFSFTPRLKQQQCHVLSCPALSLFPVTHHTPVQSDRPPRLLLFPCSHALKSRHSKREQHRTVVAAALALLVQDAAVQHAHTTTTTSTGTSRRGVSFGRFREHASRAHEVVQAQSLVDGAGSRALRPVGELALVV